MCNRQKFRGYVRVDEDADALKEAKDILKKQEGSTTTDGMPRLHAEKLCNEANAGHDTRKSADRGMRVGREGQGDKKQGVDGSKLTIRDLMNVAIVFTKKQLAGRGLKKKTGSSGLKTWLGYIMLIERKVDKKWVTHTGPVEYSVKSKTAKFRVWCQYYYRVKDN